jgi:fermentation-respiration switch protein FrsA (DUF1100 family)
MEHARQRRVPVYARPFVRIKVDSGLYKLDNLTLVKHVFQPTLFLHGVSDPHIPAWMSRSLHRTCPAPQKSLALINGNHFLMDSPTLEAVIDEIAGFIEETSSSATGAKPITLRK